MGIIANVKDKMAKAALKAVDKTKNVAVRAAGAVGDGIAAASKLSPKQLEIIAKKREEFLAGKPNPTSDDSTRYIEKTLGSVAIESYQAYLPQIKEIYQPVDMPYDDFDTDKRVAYFDITKWVFDKEENYIDKLVNVYHVLSEENCNIALIYNRKQTDCTVTVAVVNNTDNDDKARAKTYLKRLKDAIQGNFPGVELNLEGDAVCSGIPECLKQNTEEQRSVATISNLATEKSEKFISQSMEKLLDGIVPKNHYEDYTLVLLATPIKEQLEKKNRLCELSSKLAPYTSWQTNFTYTESDTNSSSASGGLNVGVFKSNTNTTGANVNANIGIPGVGSIGGGVSKSHSSTTGFNFGVNFSRSSTVSVQIGKNEGITQTFTNYTIKHTLEVLEKQIQWLEQCSALGMWNFAGYVISQDSTITNNVAHMYLALTQGENSYITQSSVNLWENTSCKTECETICNALSKLQHPLFGLQEELVKTDENYYLYPALIDATTMVSGKELAYALNIPRKSISGLPVLECVPFGREVHTFDENEAQPEITLGSIYHMRQEEKKDVKLKKCSLSSHTFITGSTGSGKSNTVYQMLNELKKSDVKFLVIEPAKGEYKNEFGKHADAVYGNNLKVTALLRINPFSFYGDTHILEHLDRLIEIFNVCWPMYAAMPAVLKEAVEKSYEDCGWNLTESTNKYGNNLYPTFADVMRNIRTVIDSSDYDKDNKGAYKGSLETRLRSLTNGINGQIFTTDELSNEELFDRNVIVDLSRVGSSETKSLIMGLLVLKLQEYRMNQGSSKLKHVTVLEEAHNLLKRTSTEQSSESANLIGKSVEMLTNSIAEMRSFGEGFIIADQAPGLLDMAVIRNTNTKIILRLPEQSDRELVGKSANLNDDQITELAKLPCGVAAVYQNEWVEPVLCKVKKFEDCGKFNFEDKNENTKQNNNARNIVSLQIARLLLSLRDEKEAEKIKLYLEHLSFRSSLYVSIERYIETKPKKPDFVKLGPIVSELLPDLKKSILENPFENRTLEDVRHNLHVLICELVKDETLRQNLLQCFLSDYAYNVLGNPERLSDLKRKENQ